MTETYNILVSYDNNKEVLLELPKSSNVFDLKMAIACETSIDQEHQVIEGLSLPPDLLTNEVLTYFRLGKPFAIYLPYCYSCH